MPRRPRIVAPGIPLHLIRRGDNHQACFFAEDNYLTYLEWLVEHPGDYRWSSSRYHAQGEESKLLQPHFMYKSLGKTALNRQRADK